MRAWTVLVAAVSVLVVFGCEQQKRDEIPQVDLEELAPAGPATDEPVERQPAVVVEKAPPAPAEVAAPAPETPAQRRGWQPKAPQQTYTMKPGDTLYTLARRFYGDGKLWTKILEANKDKIRDLYDIPIGTVLTIPPK